MAECKSYRPGNLVCRDGFIQKLICSGRVGCWSCGQVSDRETPNCLKEELPAHWINDDGSPRFYRSDRQ